MNQEIARSLQKVGEAFRLEGPFFSYEVICQGNEHVTSFCYTAQDALTEIALICGNIEVAKK